MAIGVQAQLHGSGDYYSNPNSIVLFRKTEQPYRIDAGVTAACRTIKWKALQALADGRSAPAAVGTPNRYEAVPIKTTVTEGWLCRYAR